MKNRKRRVGDKPKGKSDLFVDIANYFFFDVFCCFLFVLDCFFEDVVVPFLEVSLTDSSANPLFFCFWVAVDF